MAPAAMCTQLHSQPPDSLYTALTPDGYGSGWQAAPDAAKACTRLGQANCIGQGAVSLSGRAVE
jgi:hypothetical protein